MVSEIIETTNTKATKNAVRQCVDKNGMMAVVAEIGSGKTTMFNYLEEHWRNHPETFRVVTVKSFDSPFSRIGIIMKLLLEALSPSIHIPHGNEMKYKLLTTELRKYSKKNFKIILMIDEAQDLRNQTFRDIKKIHEITGNGMSHLFSVIFFGKTAKKWDAFLQDTEIGYRMNMTYLEPLSEEDILKIASEKYKINFETDRVRKRFCSMSRFKTPLGIEYFTNLIKREVGVGIDDPVYINTELLLKIPTIVTKARLKHGGITQQQLADYARKVSPNRKYNLQRISEWLNGKIASDDPVARDLELIAEQIMANAYNVRRGKISGDIE